MPRKMSENANRKRENAFSSMTSHMISIPTRMPMVAMGSTFPKGALYGRFRWGLVNLSFTSAIKTAAYMTRTRGRSMSNNV